jgi:hypothetical protein
VCTRPRAVYIHCKRTKSCQCKSDETLNFPTKKEKYYLQLYPISKSPTLHRCDSKRLIWSTSSIEPQFDPAFLAPGLRPSPHVSMDIFHCRARPSGITLRADTLLEILTLGSVVFYIKNIHQPISHVHRTSLVFLRFLALQWLLNYHSSSFSTCAIAFLGRSDRPMISNTP